MEGWVEQEQVDAVVRQAACGVIPGDLGGGVRGQVDTGGAYGIQV